MTYIANVVLTTLINDQSERAQGLCAQSYTVIYNSKSDKVVMTITYTYYTQVYVVCAV